MNEKKAAELKREKELEQARIQAFQDRLAIQAKLKQRDDNEAFERRR
jgi:hypothetical protein